MSEYAAKARSVRRRVRRRIARWASAEHDAELRETRRKLRATRRKLSDTRSQLREAQAQLGELKYALPEQIEDVIARARREHLTFLKENDLRELASIVLEAEKAKLPGLIVEAGTARGGSAMVIAAAKAPERPMKVYDVFGMIPPPSEHDGPDVHRRYTKIAAGEASGVGGETYYGYRDDLLAEVTDSFTRLGVPADERRVELIQGLFEDTIDLDEPVAFAHLDGDWYESTMTCLTRIAPLLVPGGRIVLDDYFMWSGCRKAVDEYFAGRDEFELRHRAKLHVIRR
jgi:asparagine synthase (glutamine-hydrolysing)